MAGQRTDFGGHGRMCRRLRGERTKDHGGGRHWQTRLLKHVDGLPLVQVDGSTRNEPVLRRQDPNRCATMPFCIYVRLTIISIGLNLNFLKTSDFMARARLFPVTIWIFPARLMIGTPCRPHPVMARLDRATRSGTEASGNLAICT